MQILVWTAAYYVTSTVSTLWAKNLVDHPDASRPLTSGSNVAVSVLTLVQLVVSLAADICVMRFGGVTQNMVDTRHMASLGRGDDTASSSGGGISSDLVAPMLPALSAAASSASLLLSVPPLVAGEALDLAASRHGVFEIVTAFTPISIFVICSKLTTYLSYYYVSVSLSHTAKASEPIFNVLVAALVFGEFHSSHVYLSLLPIALGITLASVTDFSYNHIGFFWSVASALMKVLQNIYTKRLMLTGRFTFWEIHLFCGAASLVIFAPVVALQSLSANVNPFARLVRRMHLTTESFCSLDISISSYPPPPLCLSVTPVPNISQLPDHCSLPEFAAAVRVVCGLVPRSASCLALVLHGHYDGQATRRHPLRDHACRPYLELAQHRRRDIRNTRNLCIPRRRRRAAIDLA